MLRGAGLGAGWGLVDFPCGVCSNAWKHSVVSHLQKEGTLGWRGSPHAQPLLGMVDARICASVSGHFGRTSNYSVWNPEQTGKNRCGLKTECDYEVREE